jgi:hypothetical protein
VHSLEDSEAAEPHMKLLSEYAQAILPELHTPEHHHYSNEKPKVVFKFRKE